MNAFDIHAAVLSSFYEICLTFFLVYLVLFLYFGCNTYSFFNLYRHIKFTFYLIHTFQYFTYYPTKFIFYLFIISPPNNKANLVGRSEYKYNLWFSYGVSNCIFISSWFPVCSSYQELELLNRFKITDLKMN